MAEDARLPVTRGAPGSFEAQVHDFLAAGHDADGAPTLGIARVQTVDKTLAGDRSLILLDYYRLTPDATFTIEPDADMRII